MGLLALKPYFWTCEYKESASSSLLKISGDGPSLVAAWVAETPAVMDLSLKHLIVSRIAHGVVRGMR